MWICILMTCAGFLSGSIMYAYLIPKVFRKIDIRIGSEDGNPGSGNAISTTGPFVGGVCLLLDIGKAFAPVYVAVAWFAVTDYRLIPVMIAPVLGHAFTPLLRFRGGKAVAASFGALLGVITVSWVVAVYVITLVFVSAVVVLNPNSFKITAGFILSAILAFLLEPIPAIRVAAVIISALVCCKHFLNPNAGDLSVKAGPFVFRIGGGTGGRR